MRTPLSAPPRGYNSYNGFNWSITEAEFRATVEFCDKELKPYGFEYMVIDACWSHPGISDVPNANQTDDLQPTLMMDRYGRLIPTPDRYPSSTFGAGLRPLADWVHGKGFKFGIHLMRGVPRQAAAMKAPILGSEFTCDQIVDAQGVACDWQNQMAPLNMAHPGAQAYLDSIFALYEGWALDFFKIDDISWPYHAEEIEGYERAIAKTGREMVISLSPGAVPPEQWQHVAQYSDMWRISNDFWDRPDHLYANFDRYAVWSALRVPGAFPDGDMLPFSKVSLRGPVGEPRYSKFTYDEKMSQLSLWCLCNAPLMLGGDVTVIDSATLKLLQNPDVLAVDNEAADAKRILVEDGRQAWTARHQSIASVQYLALFNTQAKCSALFKPSDYLPGKQYRELWTGRILTPGDALTIRPHGAAMFEVIT